MTDIEKFAKEVMGITLLPIQVEMIRGWAEEKSIMIPRSAGKTTAKKVALAYLKRATDKMVE